MRSARRALVGWGLSLLLAAPAAAIDLTGTWEIYFGGGNGHQAATITQTGTTLAIRLANGAPLDGTIDPQTGAFNGEGAVQLACAEATGTASADGNALSATISTGYAQCSGGPGGPFCTCEFNLTVGMLGCRTGTGLDCCGDALVGATEACDDGPDPSTGCCADTCQPQNVGGACTADLNQCTLDLCDATGVCTHDPATAGTPCADEGDACTLDVCDGAAVCTHSFAGDTDGDGRCDPEDPCVAGATLGRTRVMLSGFETPAADDRLSVRTVMTFAAAPVLDPPTTGLRLRLEDLGGTLALAVTLPPGAFDGTSGWKSHGSGSTFRSDTPVGGAVTAARVARSASAPEAVRVSVKGRRANIASTPPVGPLAVTIVLDPADPASTCGDRVFAAPAPECAVRGDTLICR